MAEFQFTCQAQNEDEQQRQGYYNRVDPNLYLNLGNRTQHPQGQENMYQFEYSSSKSNLSPKMEEELKRRNLVSFSDSAPTQFQSTDGLGGQLQEFIEAQNVQWYSEDYSIPMQPSLESYESQEQPQPEQQPMQQVPHQNLMPNRDIDIEKKAKKKKDKKKEGYTLREYQEEVNLIFEKDQEIIQLDEQLEDIKKQNFTAKQLTAERNKLTAQKSRVKQRLEMDFLRENYIKLRDKAERGKPKDELCRRCQKELGGGEEGKFDEQSLLGKRQGRKYVKRSIFLGSLAIVSVVSVIQIGLSSNPPTLDFAQESLFDSESQAESRFLFAEHFDSEIKQISDQTAAKLEIVDLEDMLDEFKRDFAMRQKRVERNEDTDEDSSTLYEPINLTRMANQYSREEIPFGQEHKCQPGDLHFQLDRPSQPGLDEINNRIALAMCSSQLQINYDSIMEVNFGDEPNQKKQYLMLVFKEQDVIYQLNGEDFQLGHSQMYIELEAELKGVRRLQYPS